MELFAFDDDYVRRLQVRDRDTVAHFERYIRDLMKIKFQRKVRSVEDLEDILQETLARVFQKLDTVKDGHKLGAFTSITSDHVYHEKIREDVRAKRGDAILPAPPQKSTLDDLIDEETRQRVRRAVDQLADRDREILYAVFLNEEEKDGICTRFGVSREYLRVLQHRALEKFREEFV